MATSGKKIGILTGGGDVPGLNSVIKSVVYRASNLGREVIGIRRGWKGLSYMNAAVDEDPEYVWHLNRDNTRTIDRTGGTVLHTSRTNPRRMSKSKVPEHVSAQELAKLPTDGKTYDFTPFVLRNLEKLGIGCLVTIGGDDTLSYSSWLTEAGFPVIAVPKTMDNDVQGTEYCIGFSTAITRASELVTRRRTILGSHERIGVFRIFGRDAGFTSLYTAYVAGTRSLIPEYPFDLDKLIELLISDKKVNPSRYSIAIISEGAVWKGREIGEEGEADAYGHKKKVDIGQALADEIQKRTGQETLVNDLTYDIRCGAPDVVDQMVATTYGNIAMDLLADGAYGQMVGVKNGCYAHMNIPSHSLGPRKVDVATLYDTERYRPNFTGKVGTPFFLTRA